MDWKIIAEELKISNAHAARMRFFRLKQQQDGVTLKPRKGKGDGVARRKRPKGEISKDDSTSEVEVSEDIKSGSRKTRKVTGRNFKARVKPKPFMKAELSEMEVDEKGIVKEVKAEPLMNEELSEISDDLSKPSSFASTG